MTNPERVLEDIDRVVSGESSNVRSLVLRDPVTFKAYQFMGEDLGGIPAKNRCFGVDLQWREYSEVHEAIQGGFQECGL